MIDESLTQGRVAASSTDDPSPTETESGDSGVRTRGGSGVEPRRLQVGERFANYEILGLLGRGAMGIVYEARDTTLERRVALKLLRSARQRATERLLREARALARLDHPNVVRIWAADVHQGSLYIAMELVQGQSLREWLQTRRTWSEVLPVMIAAGRGLAAAHEAGVVHRDFKPENVLVGWDGRARVVDFGIARVGIHGADEATRDGVVSIDSLSSSSSLIELDTREVLTEQGALIGTVLYMSPEQHEREPADEASDQFAFCLTLFEAVYGRHPFPARTQPELAIKVHERQIDFPEHSAGPQPPRWLRQAIVRGLAPSRVDRHPSMSALLAELERHPARRRMRRRVAALTGMLMAAVALGVLLPEGQADSVCVDAASELDERLGEDRRARLRERFTKLGEPSWAKPTAARFDRALRAWGDRWIDARTRACELRAAHGGEPTQLDEARELCLTRQLDEVASLVELLGEADQETLQKSPRMLLALPEPSRCSGDHPPPSFTASTPAGEALHRELVRLRWPAMVGGSAQIRAQAEELVTAARSLELPSERVLLADALMLLGKFETFDGDVEAAEQHLREAKREALRLDAEEIQLQAEIELGWLLAQAPGRADDAHTVLEDAAPLFERIGAGRMTRVHWQQARGEVLLARGELLGARMVLEGLVHELEASDDLLSLALARNSLASVALAERDHERALALGRQAIESMETLFGPSYPLLAAPLHNVGQALAGLGRDEEARASYERSVALRRAQAETSEGLELGGKRRLAETLTELGNLDSIHGRASARERYEEALRLLGDEDPAQRAHVLFNLGVDHQLRGEHEPALAAYRESLRLALPIYPDASREVAAARLGVGVCLLALGRPEEARDPLERARTSWPSVLVGTPDEAELEQALTMLQTG